MEDLHIVSIYPVSTLKIDEQKAHKGPIVGSNCLFKSINIRSSLTSHFLRQSCKGGFTNNTNKWRLRTNSSSQNSLNSGASDGSAEVRKGDNAAERNSRKKTRKWGKRNKNFLIRGLTEHEYVDEKSMSVSDNTYSFGPPVYETGLAVSPREPCCNGDSHQPKNIEIINDPATTKTLRSYENMVETSEASIPYSPKNSHASHCIDGLKNFNGKRQYMHNKSTSSLDYPHYAEMNDSLVLDFLSLGLKSEESCPDNYFKLCDEKNDDGDITELPHYIVRKQISPEDMLISNTEHCDDVESINIFRKDSSYERTLHTLGMREKHLRKVSKNFNISRRNSFRNLNKHTGKENSNSVWQKVQRNEGQCKPKFEKVKSVCSKFFDETKEGPVYKKDCNVAGCYMPSKPENKNRAQLKIPGKLKKEKISQRWRASHAVMTSSNFYLKTNMRQNEFLDSAQISQRKGNGVFSSHSSTWCPRIGHHPEKVDICTFKDIHYTEMSSTNLGAGDRASFAVSGLTDQPAENQANLLFNSCYPLGQSELHEALSAISLHVHVDDENDEKKEVPLAVSGRQENDSAAVLEERKSIGVGDADIQGLSCDSLSFGELCKLAGKRWSPEVMAKERLASNPYPLFFSENIGVTYNQSSKNINDLPFGDEHHKKTCSPAECSSNHDGVTCLAPEIRSQIIFESENDSNDIVSAVSGAHWSQLASEAIEMAAGCPIAEFERFLRSASPVLCTSHDAFSGQTCKAEQFAGTSVCKGETLDISLGSLWQWYELPGSYGLEVIAEDCSNSKKLGKYHFEFRAYFVPSLSAVQFFRRCTPHSYKLD